ncbi:MAG: amidohydrolase family protein [Anaerolineae bacterium]|nr:amidohydrolase family protein [Anaerolineae bacterium]
MKKADIILKGGTIITMNDNFDIIHDGMVVISNTKLVAVGSCTELEKQYESSDTIDCSGHYIMPGLVNAHTHVPMTLLRAMADDLRLDVWLMGYIMPVEREFVSPEFVKLGTTLACAEMIRGGVTAFSDMYYFESDIAQATVDAGLRAFLGESILKYPTPDAATYEESLDYTREFIEQWKDHPLITPSIAPHAPYSNTEETLKRSVELAKEYGFPMMIHIAETAREVEDSMNQYDKTVVPWVKDQGVLDVPIIAAHCVHIDEHEMRMLKKYGASVAHCPSANLKLASGIAPISQMLEMGLNVAIGTDGPASNNDLDMFEEMRLAALLAKVTPNNPTALPAKQALQMATVNGARALGLGDVTGSLEVGKFADVVVVNAHPLHNVPRFDVNPDAPYSQIVYSAKSSDVQHTICHGKILMRDRDLLTIDETALKEEAASYAERVGKFLGEVEENPLRKLVAVGVGVERAESFEIQVKAKIEDPSVIEELLSHKDSEVLRAVHYRQYDTYFIFDEQDKGRIRYREDDRIDLEGNVESVRMRLTYTSAEKERVFNDAVVLSHSRFIAPASHPLRFYEEYFQVSEQRKLQKDRRRWRMLYKGVLFFINIDRVIKPELSDMYIEIKTRTWSKTDAENKANFVHEMMDILEIDVSKVERKDYLEMALQS